MIFPFTGQTKKLEGEGEEKELFQVYLKKKVFIQCNKNSREKIFGVVRQDILTLLNVFLKGLVACKIKKGRKYHFKKVNMGCLDFSKMLFFF